MARVEVWETVIDTSGVPVSGESVHIYDARTTNHATVYSAETGPTTLSNPVTTSNGNIPGWVDEGEYDLKLVNANVTVRFNAIVGGNPTLGALAIDTADIADDAVTAAKIAAGSVGSSEIAADAVGTSEIAADAVTASEIAVGAVGSSELAADAVDNGAIQTDAVTNSKISTGAVGTDEIATDAVTAAEIAAGAVGASEIADGSITIDELDAKPIVVLSATQDIPSGAVTTITGYTEWADPGAMHSTGTNPSRITIQRDGIYRVEGNFLSSDLDLVEDDIMIAHLYLNGAAVITKFFRATPAPVTFGGDVALTFIFSATNYLEIKLQQITGSTITYNVNFTAEYLGATS